MALSATAQTVPADASGGDRLKPVRVWLYVMAFLVLCMVVVGGAARLTEFGLSITKQTLSREMRSLGFRKLSARPRHHGQKEHAIADFKKASQASWQR